MIEMSGFLMNHDEELMSESLADLQQSFGRRELQVQLGVIRLDQIKVLPGHSLRTLNDKK
jgi:hypothetical protein